MWCHFTWRVGELSVDEERVLMCLEGSLHLNRPGIRCPRPVEEPRRHYCAHMKSPLNDRQVEVLQWVADGSPVGKWPENDFSYKTSAAALKARGLLIITGHARTWVAAITEAGTSYLEHGSYPPEPEPHIAGGRAPAGDHEPAALKDAKELIERLNTEDTVTVTDPDASTRARYRRALHACKTHALVPAGQELRYTGRDTGDIIMKLVDGSSADETDWNRIRLTTRKVTMNIGALRTALVTSTILNQLSEDLRPRAIEYLVELAEHLRVHDLRLSANVKLKTPKLFLQVGTRRKDIALTEVLDEVPHEMTSQERRELRRAPWTRIPQHDQVPSGRLMLRVARDGSHEVNDKARGYTSYVPNADEYTETKRQSLNTQARRIAQAIKKGVDDDVAAQEREERRREEARSAHEQQLAEERHLGRAHAAERGTRRCSSCARPPSRAPSRRGSRPRSCVSSLSSSRPAPWNRD